MAKQDVACKIRYTPAELLASLMVAFVAQGSAPSIDGSGRPTYPMSKDTGKTAGSGCAVYRLFAMHPEVIAKLNKIATHQACPASNLASEGINTAALVDSDWDDYTKTQFVNEAQKAHDTAAIKFFELRRDVPEVSKKAAMAYFRRLFVRGIRDVAKRYAVNTGTIEGHMKNWLDGSAEARELMATA